MYFFRCVNLFSRKMGAGGDSHITVFHHLAVNKLEGEIYIDLYL